MRRRCGLESALRTAAERRNDPVRRRLSLSCRFGDADTSRLQQSAALPDPLAVQYAAAEQQCRGCGVWSRIKLERARRRSRTVAEGSRAASLTCRCQVPSAKWRRTPASQMWSQASSAARPRSSAPCAKPPRPCKPPPRRLCRYSLRPIRGPNTLQFRTTQSITLAIAPAVTLAAPRGSQHTSHHKTSHTRSTRSHDINQGNHS